MARKGGFIIEVVAGLRKGYFGQVVYAKQKAQFASANKVLVDYFDDTLCTLRSIGPDKKPLSGITNHVNLKVIGFYD